MDKKVTEVVEAFAQPIVEELNLELVDVEYVKEGQDWFLRDSSILKRSRH